MALLNYENPSIGLEAPDTSDIRKVVSDDWIAAFNEGNGAPVLDTEAATPAGQLVDAETSYIAQANAELLYLANQFDPRKAEGVFQDALAAIYFITRNVARPTRVDCVCMGLAGTVIPAGSIVQATTGVKFQSAQEATIPVGGTTTVTFACMTPGAIQCDAHSVKTIITVIAGWDTVDNPAAGDVGNLVESQIDFETRRFASVQANGNGSAATLEGALLNLEGVTACKVLENSTSENVQLYGVTIPPHSIAICIAGTAEPSAIAKTIYERKSAGCPTIGYGGTPTSVSYTEPVSGNTYTFYVIEPTNTDIKVNVTVDYYDDIPADLSSRVRQAVTSDFYGENKDSGNRRVTFGEKLFASRFSTAVIVTAGCPTLKSITVALGSGAAADNISIPAYVLPVISDNDITLTVTNVP